ncbi:MAG: hypothetical protein ACTSVI_15165 [Promethearchaeota archaeon]
MGKKPNDARETFVDGVVQVDVVDRNPIQGNERVFSRPTRKKEPSQTVIHDVLGIALQRVDRPSVFR